MYKYLFALDEPFVATEGLPVPFVEWDAAALCSGDGPDPFENGLEVPFELLASPPNLILGAGRLRFLRCSISAWRDPGSS